VRGAFRSTSSHPSITARNGPNFGAGLPTGTRLTGGTALEHATTIDQHEIGGQMYDAIFCMGGGYYPRFVALDRHLRGDLPPTTTP